MQVTVEMDRHEAERVTWALMARAEEMEFRARGGWSASARDTEMQTARTLRVVAHRITTAIAASTEAVV
jgi:hypothetical protein